MTKRSLRLGGASKRTMRNTAEPKTSEKMRETQSSDVPMPTRNQNRWDMGSKRTKKENQLMK